MPPMPVGALRTPAIIGDHRLIRQRSRAGASAIFPLRETTRSRGLRGAESQGVSGASKDGDDLIPSTQGLTTRGGDSSRTVSVAFRQVEASGGEGVSVRAHCQPCHLATGAGPFPRWACRASVPHLQTCHDANGEPCQLDKHHRVSLPRPKPLGQAQSNDGWEASIRTSEDTELMENVEQDVTRVNRPT